MTAVGEFYLEYEYYFASSQLILAMLGMGAMMGAALQAPLAALLALLELTGNPLVLMPAMLAVVSANLTAKIVFR